MPSLGPKPQWNLPNALTLLRVLLVPVLGYLLLTSRDNAHAAAATLVFAAASLTDLADGRIARVRGEITAFGELWDPIADKALTGMAFIGLSITAEVPWWVTIVIMVRELGITWMRFSVVRRTVVPASRGGKTKTALQMVTLAMLMAAPIVFSHAGPSAAKLWSGATSALVWATLAMTIATGIDYILGWRRLTASTAGTHGLG